MEFSTSGRTEPQSEQLHKNLQASSVRKCKCCGQSFVAASTLLGVSSHNAPQLSVYFSEVILTF